MTPNLILGSHWGWGWSQCQKPCYLITTHGAEQQWHQGGGASWILSISLNLPRLRNQFLPILDRRERQIMENINVSYALFFRSVNWSVLGASNFSCWWGPLKKLWKMVSSLPFDIWYGRIIGVVKSFAIALAFTRKPFFLCWWDELNVLPVRGGVGWQVGRERREDFIKNKIYIYIYIYCNANQAQLK